jgi:hypothetical protein
LGAVSELVVDVTQATSAPLAVVVHPVGKAGAVTPSKFSKEMMLYGFPIEKKLGDVAEISGAILQVNGRGQWAPQSGRGSEGERLTHTVAPGAITP